MFEITKQFFESRGLITADRRLPYNPDLRDRAKELRKNMTRAEKKLWFEFLQGCEYRFLRQRPIDNFIVDFYCQELSIVIELDGDSHYEDGTQEYDAERTDFLEGYELKVIRFSNQDVYNNFEEVCNEIKKYFN